MRSSTQGSSVRIDRFVFRSTSNSKKLDELVKSWVLNCVNLIFPSYSIIASRLFGSDFIGGEMTVNQHI